MGIEWKEGFALGVTEVDDQHQELFARLDRLFLAMKEGREASELAEVFQFLDDYTREHFRAEEALQKRLNYPHLAIQQEEHEQFLKRLDDLRERLQAEGPTPAMVKLVAKVFDQWLVTHVCNVDREFGEFVLATRRSSDAEG